MTTSTASLLLNITSSVILLTNSTEFTTGPNISLTRLNTSLTPEPPTCLACRSSLLTAAFSILFSLIVLLGILGNAFVVAVIVFDRKLLSSSVNQFLLNLALADIGNLVFCSPDMLMVLIDRGWLLPDSACHFLRFLQEYFLYASVLLQMSIGIERYLAICAPLRMQRFTNKTTVCVIVSMWSIAGAFALPYFISQGIIVVSSKYKYCLWKGIAAWQKTFFKWAEFSVLYGVPLVLLTVLYTVMGRVLWGKSATIANETQQEAILKLRRSVVKMLIISMFLYFLCYTPIQAIFIIETVFRRAVHLPSWLRLLINALSVMSSSANPIVYIICCRHFHSRFVVLLRYIFSLLGCVRKEEKATIKYPSERESSCIINRTPYVSFKKTDRKKLFLAASNQQNISLL